MSAPAPNPTPSTNRWRKPLMIGGVAIVLIGAAVLWLLGGRYMSTDDAYVRAARATISSNVAGEVAEIDVHDNQPVHRGDVLFRLDERPYRIAVEEARAKLATARLQVIAVKSTYRSQLATLASAQATLAYQRTQFARQQKLNTAGIASQSQLDDARHALDDAQQKVAADRQQVASVLAMLGGNADIDPDQHPAVQQAQAELDRAELNLSYTVIHAPDDGIVTQVEQLQVGDHINAGTAVFALMSTQDVWVEANFKESQLTYMRPGQPATVEIDSYPGHDFKAHVVSVAPGTGSEFSVLPAENATGNWVKVVQRLPVRIALDADEIKQPLRAGLSATAEVDTGHRRSLFGTASAETP